MDKVAGGISIVALVLAILAFLNSYGVLVIEQGGTTTTVPFKVELENKTSHVYWMRVYTVVQLENSTKYRIGWILSVNMIADIPVRVDKYIPFGERPYIVIKNATLLNGTGMLKLTQPAQNPVIQGYFEVKMRQWRLYHGRTSQTGIVYIVEGNITAMYGKTVMLAVVVETMSNGTTQTVYLPLKIEEGYRYTTEIKLPLEWENAEKYASAEDLEKIAVK